MPDAFDAAPSPRHAGPGLALVRGEGPPLAADAPPAAPASRRPLPDEAAPRRPLWNDEAEAAVLGACLLDNTVIPQVRAILSGAEFYRVGHATVYAAMLALHDAGDVVDVLTLPAALERAGDLAACGGREYVGYLVDAVPTSANVAYHARFVRERARERQVVALCEATIAAVHGGATAADAAQQLAADALPVAIDGSREGFTTSGDVVWETLDALEAKQRGAGTTMVATGYPELDEPLAGGFDVGELAFLCAAPGGCKTALGLNLALQVAEAGHGAAIVSAEMSRRANMQRLLSRLSRVHARKLREAVGLTRDDWDALGRAGQRLARLPLWIDDAPTPTMRAIEAKCRRLKAAHSALRFLVVDFIQLLETGDAAGGGRRGDGDDNRALALTRIAYRLKGLAKELGVVVVCTSQVDAAAVEKRSDKRPLLSDIRWSQGMREAGDFVGLLYRPRAYDPLTIGDPLEINWAKARDAEPFVAQLDWQGATQTVASRRRDERPVTVYADAA